MKFPIKFLNVTLVIFLGALLAVGCQDKDTIVLKDLSDAERDSTQWDQIDEDALTSIALGFDATLGKGAVWRAWRQLHKDCMKNEWLKKPSYVGVGNSVGLGTILTPSNGLQAKLTDTFTPEEVKILRDTGVYRNCGFKRDFSLNITALVQADIEISDMADALEAELTTKIQSSKKTKMQIDKWRPNKLHEGKLTEWLDSGDQSRKRFKDYLKTSGNRIITTEIEIDGFASTLEFETEISPELEAKLNSGAIANVGDGKFKFQLKIINKKTIEMKSIDKAYVFVELKKGEVLR